MNLQSLNHELIESFADCLNAQDSDDFQQRMNYFNRIENALMSNSQNNISHVYLSGSMGKNTALHYHFDVDIIVFYNCQGGYQTYLNSKEDFLDEIKEIVVEEFEDENLSKIKMFPRSFQMNINGTHIDILTGMDRLVGNEDDIGMQYNRILNIIHYKSGESPPTAAYNLQTSIAKKSDQFVLNQSDFVHNLIILCKHWCRKYLNSQVRFFGRSSAIELIAIHVGNLCEDEDEDDLSYSEAFCMFLDICSKSNLIEIEFDYSPKFKKNLINRDTPYILDPMNPYNNRLEKVSNANLNLISKIAKKSRQIFLKCFNNPDRFDNFFGFRDQMGDNYINYNIFESDDDDSSSNESSDYSDYYSYY